mmetsp:Transcript_2731/g.7070  ORF Transcript_2731/g.7070 Transcript_2731/m.7070 type:complete len:202 (-) Transcript_2731:71-676(-)
MPWSPPPVAAAAVAPGAAPRSPHPNALYSSPSSAAVLSSVSNPRKGIAHPAPCCPLPCRPCELGTCLEASSRGSCSAGACLEASSSGSCGAGTCLEASSSGSWARQATPIPVTGPAVPAIPLSLDVPLDGMMAAPPMPFPAPQLPPTLPARLWVRPPSPCLALVLVLRCSPVLASSASQAPVLRCSSALACGATQGCCEPA